MLEETKVIYHGIVENVYLELEDEANFHPKTNLDINKYLKAGVVICFTVLSLYLLLMVSKTSQPVVETQKILIENPIINTTTPISFISSDIEPWKDCFYRLNWCSPLMNVGTGNSIKEVTVACRNGYTNVLDCKTLKLRW